MEPKLTRSDLAIISLALREVIRDQILTKIGTDDCRKALTKVRKALGYPSKDILSDLDGPTEPISGPKRKALSSQFISKFGRLASIVEARFEDLAGEYDGTNERGFFEDAFRDLVDGESGWWDGAHQLFDLSNWNWRKLKTVKNGVRKPRVTLVVDVTSKQNLVLEWFPRTEGVKDQFEYFVGECCYNVEEDYDFLTFSSLRPIAADPDNRILMIRGLGGVYSFQKDTDGNYNRFYKRSEQLLIEMADALLRDVQRSLSEVFDVILRNNLYLKYDSENWQTRRLISWDIRSVKEIEAENKAAAKAKWLKETFEIVGLSADEFLRIFESTGRQYSPTERALEKRNVMLSRQRIKTLTNRLYDDYPELYQSCCSGPPQGRELPSVTEKPAMSGKLLKFDSGEPPKLNKDPDMLEKPPSTDDTDPK